jgi:hypothetical protein
LVHHDEAVTENVSEGDPIVILALVIPDGGNLAPCPKKYPVDAKHTLDSALDLVFAGHAVHPPAAL